MGTFANAVVLPCVTEGRMMIASVRDMCDCVKCTRALALIPFLFCSLFCHSCCPALRYRGAEDDREHSWTASSVHMHLHSFHSIHLLYSLLPLLLSCPAIQGRRMIASIRGLRQVYT